MDKQVEDKEVEIDATELRIEYNQKILKREVDPSKVGNGSQSFPPV